MRKTLNGSLSELLIMVLYFDIETEGLNPYKHQVLTIQVKKGKRIEILKLWEEPSEADMILKFVEYLSRISNNETIFGYNCLKFDVPFLATRLTQHGVMKENIYRSLFYKKWFDLYQFQGDEYVSMTQWLNAYGIQRSCSYEGKDIPGLYKARRYDDIVEHAIDDLVVCEQLVKALRKHYPDFL